MARPNKECVRLGKNVDADDSPLSRFKKSMVIDYEKWHDGVGYDLESLRDATPEERNAIVDLLITGDLDWRDVEALAAVGTPRAHKALRRAASGGSPMAQMAVLRYAPELIDESKRTKLIVLALRTAVIYNGLSQALGEVEKYHPPEIVHELLSGLLKREGNVAVLFAAMLFFIHGKSGSPFDMKQRPFFLRFNTEMASNRRRVFRELCEVIGVDPGGYL